MTKLMSIVFLVVGIFCFNSAKKNANWLYNSRKMALYVKLFGAKGARLFLMGISILIMILALIMFFKF